MRILYLCPDPGVRVDEASGAGAHVFETIRALRNLGHEVRLLAADGNAPAGDGFRVHRHRWFPALLALAGRDPGTRSMPTPASSPAGSAPSNEATLFVPAASTVTHPSQKRIDLPQRISAFLHGPLRHHLNLLEESAVYPRRFFRAALWHSRQFRPHAVYERYALGHHAAPLHFRKVGLPHIMEVNALLAEERARHGGGRGVWARRRASAERQFLAQCPKVFAVSDSLKRAIAPDDSRVSVLPNGVDADLFRPDVDPGPVRERYGLIGAPTVGWIGGFGPSRGLEAVLAIAERVHRRRPEVRFLMAGDGPLMPRVREQLRRDGTENVVRLTGRVARSEVPALVAAFDVALAPYPAEGAAYFSPLKIFEYMAAGRAILATDAGQSAELLADGVGVLLSPEPTDDWAHRIPALLDDPEERRRMGAAARERVVQDHTWEANARRIVHAFDSAYSGTSRP